MDPYDDEPDDEFVLRRRRPEVDDGDDIDPLGVARLRVRAIWLTLALVAVLAIGAVYGHGLVEDDIDARAGRALDREGFEEVDIEIVGRDVTLVGSVDTEADAERAAETVRALDGIKGITIDLQIGEPNP